MELLDAGRVVGTHGVRGEVRLDCWCDSPSFLKKVKTLYLDGEPLTVDSARPHKHLLLLKLRGIDTVEAAMAFRGKVLQFDKSSVPLPKGRYYIEDLTGCAVVDEGTGKEIGTLTEVLRMPIQDVYVVEGEGREWMIPAVPEFVQKVDLDAGVIRVRVIEGM